FLGAFLPHTQCGVLPRDELEFSAGIYANHPEIGCKVDAPRNSWVIELVVGRNHRALPLKSGGAFETVSAKWANQETEPPRYLRVPYVFHDPRHVSISQRGAKPSSTKKLRARYINSEMNPCATSAGRRSSARTSVPALKTGSEACREGRSVRWKNFPIGIS